MDEYINRVMKAYQLYGKASVIFTAEEIDAVYQAFDGNMLNVIISAMCYGYMKALEDQNGGKVENKN